MTRLSFDIFARDYASKELDKLDKKFRDSAKKAGDFGDKASASFLRTANSLSNIPTAAAALNGVGSIVSSLSGVLGLLPAAAAAAAAGIATLAVGTSGFADGLKELADSSKIQKSTGGVADAAVQAARRIEAANASLIRAQRGVKDAEEGLTRAQRDAVDAQQELTRAREQATEKLDDLGRSVSGAALDQEAAVLGVQRAQERLVELQKSGGSALDFSEAELGVRQAQQALVETTDRYADLRKEAELANKAGVDGSDEVVAAQRQVADSALGVQHAQQGVADAAEAVRDAQREVAQAHEDAARSASKAASALSGNTAAFDKLSKNAQDTVRAILGLSDAWTGLRHSVQDALFAGVASEVKMLGGTYIPVLKAGMTEVAGQFNSGAHSLGDFLNQGEQVKSVQAIFKSTTAVSGQLADSLKPLVSIMLDVSAVGSEMLPGLTGGFSKAAEGAVVFVRNARETGALREWIQGGLDTLHKLGELFGNIAGIVGTVFAGLNAGGKNFLDTMVSVTGKIEDFLRSFQGQQALKALGQALQAVSSVVTQVLITALKELAPLIVQIAPGFAELAKQVGQVLVVALQIAAPLLQAVAKGLSDNIDWLGPLVIGLYAGAKAFTAINAVLIALKLEALSNPWLAIIAATIALAVLIITHWDAIKAALKAAWDWIARTAGTAWEGIKIAIVNPIVTAAKWVGDVVGNIVGFFADLPRRIGSVLSGLGTVLSDAFKGALNFVIGILNWFIDRANNVIYGINVISPFDDIPSIPHIAKLHSGGVVPGVVGQEKLAILQAGETVLPVDWSPPVMAMNNAASAQGPTEVRVQLVVGPGADSAVAAMFNNLSRRGFIKVASA